ncbi:target of EGR1 protein 1 [Genypterus blacodes]|uniref:target of EGR1 protein 1 n=1 Tax=Genypterus blacodes TaxID=154954 RepID=UPI003F760DA3
MTSSMVVPVIDVQNDNFKELWPAMVLAIKTSSFVALDTELSGLGNRKALLAESIEDRYKAICHAARTRSILSLGFACYKKQHNKAADTYLVQVYNLTLLCSEEYIIEPQSVQFLVQHGFDFNKQYSHGIPYCKGNNKGGSDNHGVHIRALFTEMLRARKPLVLHNGLIDMVFLYQCFYAYLPDRLDTFTADLSEMFPAGIYDTKYASEFELRLTASYLEYAYKKCKLDNSRSVVSGVSGSHFHVEFCQYGGQMSNYVDFRPCPVVDGPCPGETDLCQSFSAFGWCRNGSKCTLSHDTDLIILQDEKCKDDKKSRRKRKRERKRAGGNGEGGSVSFEGAPVNKMPHMDTDETPEHQQGATCEQIAESGLVEGNTAGVQPTDPDGGNKQKEEKVVPEEGENGVSEDSKPSKTSAKTDVVKPKIETGTHRAGFDAFMTGYIFAHAQVLIKEEGGGGAAEKEPQGEEEQPIPSCLNKIYLSGKSVPLHIVKSTFAKSSKAHVQKMEMVWGARV